MEKTMNEEGLRERKRAALQATIERAALDLMLEHGYEAVTVDMICAASLVSPRTFFNYFGSKEGVILGATPPTPSTEEIGKFTDQGTDNVLADFVVMITTALVDMQVDPVLLRSRWLLIQRTPELFDRQLVRIAETEEQLVLVLLMRSRGQGRDMTAPSLHDEARMIVALGMGVMRFVMRKRISGEFAGSSQELVDGAIELIKNITSDTTNHN